MPNILKEGIDFSFIETEGSFGGKVQVPKQINGPLLKRVVEPYRNSVVYIYKKEEKALIPIIIKDGCYLSNGRLSNFWYWFELNEELEVVGESSGYGGFYQTLEPFNVELKYIVTKK